MRTNAGWVSVEDVRTRRAEGAEAGQRGVARALGARESGCARVLRAEHRFPEQHVDATEGWARRGRCRRRCRATTRSLGFGTARQGLFGAVIDARNTQAAQLQGGRNGHLVLDRRVGAEAHLPAEDVIVVVEHGYVARAPVAM